MSSAPGAPFGLTKPRSGPKGLTMNTTTSRRAITASLFALGAALAAGPAKSAQRWGHGDGGDRHGNGGGNGHGDHGGARGDRGPRGGGDRGPRGQGGGQPHAAPPPQRSFQPNESGAPPTAPRRFSGSGGGQPNWRSDRPERGGAPHTAPAWRSEDGGPRRGFANGDRGPRDQGPRDQGPRDQGPRDQGSRELGARDLRGGDNERGRGQWAGRSDFRSDGPRSGDRGPTRNSGPRNSGPRGNDRGGRDWVRNHGNDHAWGRGDWNRTSVRRIPEGRYFGRSQITVCERYFRRRCVLFSSGWRGPWRRPWRVGYVIPAYVSYWPLPYDCYYDLPPCPYGYDYCQVDGGDILLISLLTGLIIDAILFL